MRVDFGPFVLGAEDYPGVDAGRKFGIGLKSDPERNIAQCFVVRNAA